MGHKILVVDDDSDVVELLRFSLKKAGYAIGTACDGAEALKKVCTLAPDLILLDLMMPEMDGFAVCEILRRDPATENIPIIMLTAASGQLSQMVGLDIGASAYMTKPFSPKEVVAKIDTLLQKVT